ncbi:MAG: PPC domain-containing protein [Alkalispirochaeta sp.]
MSAWRRLLAGCALIILVTADVAAESVLFSTENQFSPQESSEAADHVYRVRVEAGQMVEVLVRSDAVDTYVESVLPDGRHVSNDDYDGLNAGFLRTMIVGGILIIEAAPLFDEGEGPYEVIVREVGAADQIDLNESVESVFDKTDVFQGAAVDRYWFQGTEGQVLVIDLTSDNFDTYLRIQDDRGREYIDDDGGPGRNSRVNYAFDRDGVISIHASSFSGEGVGRYRLQVAEIGADPVATYQGELSAGSDRTYDGKWVDRYEYAGSAGETVSIHLQSDVFDTQLYLSGPSGESIAHDDDGGGDTNSLVTVTLPETGTYQIFVVPFIDGGGPYRLSIYR